MKDKVYVMAQRWNIYFLLIRSRLIILLVFIPGFLSAQEDSTHIIRERVRTTFENNQLLLPSSGSSFIEDLSSITTITKRSLMQPQQIRISNFMPYISSKQTFRLPYQTNPSLLFQGDYRAKGVLHEFNNGVLFGSGGQTSVPGIGRFNNASLSYQHTLNDRLILQVGVDATKINMSHITGQAFSTSGSLMYRASDRLAFKVFGSYDIGNSYGMSSNSYGATMAIDISDSFGMEFGVRRYYDTMRGRWETIPVVIPYFNIDDLKLGLDVGGILYEILRNAMFDKKGWSGNPTIAPPRFPLPIRGR